MTKRLALALLAATALAPAAHADGILLRLRHYVPPPTPYDASGVTFNPEASGLYVGAANLNGGVNTSHAIIAWRQRGMRGVPTDLGAIGNWRLPNLFGTQGNNVCNSEGGAGFNTNQDAGGWTTEGVGWTYKSTIGGVDCLGPPSQPPNPGIIYSVFGTGFNSEWESYVSIMDTSGAQGAKKGVVYMNGVQIGTFSANAADSGVGFSADWNNTRGFFMNGGNRTSGITSGGFELSDVVIDTKTPIPAACLAAFPSDPSCKAISDAFFNTRPIALGSTTTDCLLFTASYGGGTPDYCLRGDKSTFLNNTGGTAHAPTMTNLNTGSPITPVLYTAPFGQRSEPTDRPYFVWAVESQPTFSSSSTSFQVGAGGGNDHGSWGNAILAGDFLKLDVIMCYTLTDFNNAIQTPANWNKLSTTTSTNPINQTRCNHASFWQIAAGNYVTANISWKTGNAVQDPPLVSYTSSGTTFRQMNYTLSDYRSTNGVVTVNASDAAALSGSAISFSAPSVTTTKGPATLVSSCTFRDGNSPLVPPASQDLRMTSQYGVGNSPFVILSDERLTSTGATGVRTFTQPGTHSANDRAYCSNTVLANF